MKKSRNPFHDWTFSLALICLAFPAGALIFATEYGMGFEEVKDIEQLSTLLWCFWVLIAIWGIQFIIWCIKTIPSSIYLAWEKHKQWKEEKKIYPPEKVKKIDAERMIGTVVLGIVVATASVYGYCSEDVGAMREVTLVAVIFYMFLLKKAKMDYAKLKGEVEIVGSGQD